MRTALLGIGIALVATSAFGQQSKPWVHGAFEVAKLHANVFPEAIKFVNEKCQPSDSSGITGFIAQPDGAGANYNIHVWCREDMSGQRWKGDTAGWATGVPEGLNARLELKRLVILGIQFGTAPTIFLMVPEKP